MGRRKLLLVCLLQFSCLAHGIVWEDEDSVIIEASQELEESEGLRWKRQFPGFPPGWPNNIFQQFPGGFPGAIFGQRPPMVVKPPQHQPHPQPQPQPKPPGGCMTRLGEQGQCVSSRQCYPFLYSSADPSDLTEIRNPALADMYQAASTPCNTFGHHHFFFSADAHARQNMVCCPTKKPAIKPVTTPSPFPSWTLRTTSATTTTTTATPSWAQWTSSTTTPRTTWRPSHVGGIGGNRPPTASMTTTRPTQAPVASSCGVPRIVGGTEARPGSYPWVVSLVNGRKHFCGGSLIDSHTVLTAAHCVAFMTSRDVAQLRVLLGDHDLYSVNEAVHVVKKVKTLVRHRGFSSQTLHNDIALLKLDSPAPSADNIAPICLTDGSKRYDLGNMEGQVAGWGSTSFNSDTVGVLRHVNMRIWTNAECANKYGHLAQGGITGNQVCAGSPGRDSCRGDSGGPLMLNTNGFYEQIGLVSWGIACGTYPGVYTRVDRFRDWIEKNRSR